jgi:hypothetical protein
MFAAGFFGIRPSRRCPTTSDGSGDMDFSSENSSRHFQSCAPCACLFCALAPFADRNGAQFAPHLATSLRFCQTTRRAVGVSPLVLQFFVSLYGLSRFEIQLTQVARLQSVQCRAGRILTKSVAEFLPGDISQTGRTLSVTLNRSAEAWSLPSSAEAGLRRRALYFLY